MTPADRIGPPLPGAPWNRPLAVEPIGAAVSLTSTRRRPQTAPRLSRVPELPQEVTQAAPAPVARVAPQPGAQPAQRRGGRRMERFTEQLAAMVNSLLERGYLIAEPGTATSTGATPLTFSVRATPLSEARPPTVVDDLAAGAVPGALWYDSAADVVYFCAADAPAAAHWVRLSPVGLSGRIGVLCDGTFEDGLLQEANIKHLPLVNTGTQFLADDGTWKTPTGGGIGTSTVTEVDMPGGLDYTVTGSWADTGLTTVVAAGSYYVMVSAITELSASIDTSQIEVRLRDATNAVTLFGPAGITKDGSISKLTPQKDQVGAAFLPAKITAAGSTVVRLEAQYTGTPGSALIKGTSRMEVMRLA